MPSRPCSAAEGRKGAVQPAERAVGLPIRRRRNPAGHRDLPMVIGFTGHPADRSSLCEGAATLPDLPESRLAGRIPWRGRRAVHARGARRGAPGMARLRTGGSAVLPDGSQPAQQVQLRPRDGHCPSAEPEISEASHPMQPRPPAAKHGPCWPQSDPYGWQQAPAPGSCTVSGRSAAASRRAGAGRKRGGTSGEDRRSNGFAGRRPQGAVG